uniref:Delta(14)-sterol reductase TM7SF2 n=1 Tax=Latimeria chalumnae TaxID=7897 RepID=H3AEQ2_LATCH
KMADKLRTPRTTELEFGGTLGAIVLPFFLPATVLYLLLTCYTEDASIWNFSPPVPTLGTLWNSNTLLLYLAWIGFQAVLYMLPVGKVVEGMVLRDETRLKYRINGSVALFLQCKLFNWSNVLHNPVLFPLDSGRSRVFGGAGFFLGGVIYKNLLYKNSYLFRIDFITGNPIYDFFIGHELNPRIGSFDLKYFCELRPGLIGWVCTQQSKEYGIALRNLFFFYFILPSQEAVLTTMDIVHDGFGFMLAFGDLTWVPFTYTLQASFLVNHPQELSTVTAVGIVLINALGYFIFRSANSQKNTFRRDPNHPDVAGLETIPTATGKRLLVAGWWGFVRHPNYLGDLIMALAWSLPCGE